MQDASMWTRFAGIAFGLASATSWGSGDFAGGLAARRSNVFSVTVISQVAGLAVLLAVAVGRSEPLPGWPDLMWAAAAGASGTLGLLALWRAMAVGLMSVIAPVAGVLSAAVAVLAGAVMEGVPTGWQVTGFVLALAGVWLVSRQGHRDAGRGGLGLALVAGLGFGGYFILINQVGDAALFWPLAFARAASSGLSFLAVLGARAPLGPPVRLLPLVVGSGVLDIGGNAFFFLALRAGRLDVSAVLAALYPAVTVVLARIILRERVSRAQSLGIIVSLAAVVLMAGR